MSQPDNLDKCPSDVLLTRYIERSIDDQDRAAIERHLRNCQACREMIDIQFRIAAQDNQPLNPAPAWLLAKAKALLSRDSAVSVLEIAVKFSGKVFQAVETTARILTGPGLFPAIALRGKKQENDQVVLVRDESSCPVLVELLRESGKTNMLKVSAPALVKNKKNIRFTLFSAQGRKESYLRNNAEAVFSELEPGLSTITIGAGDKIIKTIKVVLEAV